MQVYEDHVAETKPYEMLGYSNTGELLQFLPQKFLRDYVKKKERLGVRSRGFLPDTQKDQNYIKQLYRTVKKQSQPQVKYIPVEQFPYKSEITIYANNKVSIINFSEKGMMGVIIENETIYGMMRMIFELAWNDR